MQRELRNHEEQQHETCCNVGAGLRKSALSLVLATLPFIFLLTSPVSQQIVALS